MKQRSQIHKAQDLLMKHRKYLKGCRGINYPMNTSKMCFITVAHSYLMHTLIHIDIVPVNKEECVKVNTVKANTLTVSAKNNAGNVSLNLVENHDNVTNVATKQFVWRQLLFSAMRIRYGFRNHSC